MPAGRTDRTTSTWQQLRRRRGDGKGDGGGQGTGGDGRKEKKGRRRNDVKGLILGAEDGALNLFGGGGGGVGGENDDDDDGAWISEETMKDILPNVKLAEYQLLGVNWMALLNRSKFGEGANTLGDNKGGTGGEGRGRRMNVNGILGEGLHRATRARLRGFFIRRFFVHWL